MHGLGPSRVMAVTRGGQVLEYNGSDRQLIAHGAPASTPMLGLHRSVDDTAIAVGPFGTITRFDGTSWTRGATIANGSELHSVWANGSTVYVGAITFPNHGVWVSTGGPFTQAASLGAVYDLWGLTSPALLVHAVGDKILKLENGTWSIERDAVPSEAQLAVWAANDGAWFAVGEHAGGATGVYGIALRKLIDAHAPPGWGYVTSFRMGHLGQ